MRALAQNLSDFDLILSDYNLPDATGMELLTAVRQRCATPLIMVTGENVGRIAAEAISKGPWIMWSSWGITCSPFPWWFRKT